MSRSLTCAEALAFGVLLVSPASAQPTTPAATPNESQAPSAGLAKPNPPPPESASEEAVQLAALEAAEEPAYPRLDIYGFADFTVTNFFLPDSSIWATTLPTNSTFALGNLNMYVDSQISKHLRSLFEVRFSLLPNGTQSISPTGQITINSTQVEDYTTYRPTRWTGIILERAYLSYDFHQAFQLLVGRFITPWGIWNVDHGTPVLIGIIAPFITVEQVLPRVQTGFQASGSWHWPRARLTYYATLSNGRGPADAYWDFDNNKAVGGRVVVSTSELGELALGMTFYYGRYTDPTLRQVVADVTGRHPSVQTITRTQYDEIDIAADVRWEYRGWTVISEIAASGISYLEHGRPRASDTLASLPPPDGRPELEPDDIVWGGYVLSGYRFAWLGVMPFFQVDYYHNDDPVVLHSVYTHLGLNVRPEPNLVVKLQYSVASLVNAKPLLIGDQPHVQAIEAQVAWAF